LLAFIETIVFAKYLENQAESSKVSGGDTK